MENTHATGSFAIGDVVRVIGNSSESINCVGDIGIVTELDPPAVRVHVPGREFLDRENVCNWHVAAELVRDQAGRPGICAA